MVHPKEYYLLLKRNELSSHEKTQRKLKCMLVSGRSQSEKATILYDSNYMILWERQNFGDGKKLSDHQWWRWGEMNRTEWQICPFSQYCYKPKTAIKKVKSQKQNNQTYIHLCLQA